MIKVCVKVNGWKRLKIGTIKTFPNNMLEELELTESQGMIGIIYTHKYDENFNADFALCEKDKDAFDDLKTINIKEEIGINIKEGDNNAA